MDGRTFIIEEPTPLVYAVENPSASYEGEDGWNRVMHDVQHCAKVRWWSKQHVWAIYIDADYNC